MDSRTARAKLAILREDRGMKIPFALGPTIPFNLPEANPTDAQIRDAIMADFDDVLLSEEGDQWGDRSKGTGLNALLEGENTADVVDMVRLEVLQEVARETPFVQLLPGPAGSDVRTGKVRVQFQAQLSDRPTSQPFDVPVGAPVAEEE